MADIQNKVIELIAEHFDRDVQEVTPKASFIDDLGADSLETVELVMKFEDEFDLDIPDDDAMKIKTVQDAIDYLQGKLS